MAVRAIMLLLLLACSCDKSAAPNGQASLTELRIGYFANVTHAQAVLGVSGGELQQAIAPVHLTPKGFNAGPSLIEALLAGEIDIGYVGPGPALSAHARTHGRGIRVIAGAADNGVLIVARPGSGIQSLSDLAGKRLATPQHGNTQDLAARHYLKDVLHQSDLGNVLPITNAEQLAMMTRGQIDASWAPEPWGSLLVARAGAHVIGEEKDLWPQKRFSLTVVVTTPQFLAAHPQVVQQFLQVHSAWTQRLQADSTGCVPQLDKALYALTGKRFDSDVLRQAISRVQFTDQALMPTFATLADWSYDLGFSASKPDLSTLFDTTMMDRLRQQPATEPAHASHDAVAR